MEAVGPSLPSFAISSLSRVTSASLDPQKHWYVLQKEICGVRPTDFSKNEIFRRFPEEIRSVATRELQPAKSAYAAMKFNRMPATVYVASTFGLIAGLLRQKGIPPDGLVNSPGFTAVISMLNSVILDFEPDCAKDLPFGAKTHENTEELGALLAERTARNESLEAELNDLLGRIAELESSLADSSVLDFSSPCCSSTPKRSDSSSGSIEDTKNCPSLGPTKKKRQVLKKCREVSSALDGVSAKYHETIASVLGNSFLYGTDEEKEKVRNTISEVVDLVMNQVVPRKACLSFCLQKHMHVCFKACVFQIGCSCILSFKQGFLIQHGRHCLT